MKNDINLKQICDDIQTIHPSQEIIFDEEKLHTAYLQYQKNDERNNTSIIGQIFMVAGVVIGAILFFVAIILLVWKERNENTILLFGILSVGGSIWMNKKIDNFFANVLSVVIYFIGILLIGYGLLSNSGSVDHLLVTNIFAILQLIIGILTLLILRKYLFVLFGVLLIANALQALIIFNTSLYGWYGYMVVFTLFTGFFFLQEAKLLAKYKKLSMMYQPVRTGLFINLLFMIFWGNIYLNMMSNLSDNYFSYNYNPYFLYIRYIVPLCNGLIILYMSKEIMQKINITQLSQKIGIYILLCGILVATAQSSMISGGILLLLLSFRVAYKTGFVISVLGLIYAVILYYYNLSTSLLNKSLLLMFSGILLLALYFWIYKKLTANEKV